MCIKKILIILKCLSLTLVSQPFSPHSYPPDKPFYYSLFSFLFLTNIYYYIQIYVLYIVIYNIQIYITNWKESILNTVIHNSLSINNFLEIIPRKLFIFPVKIKHSAACKRKKTIVLYYVPST